MNKRETIMSHLKTWANVEKYYEICIPSDLRTAAKHFCKSHMNQTQWTYKENTGVIEDTILFEYSHDEKDFRNYFKLKEKNY
jgi:hypothetical protein|tara:strand:- start:92 stop:337 length:246 start_codon:yes stop_codon:yes gene_type:complete